MLHTDNLDADSDGIIKIYMIYMQHAMLVSSFNIHL